MSDTLSHLFSNIQNGQRCHILTIESVQTKLVIAILNILQEHGYIRGYRFHPTTSNKLQILLKYKNQKPVINKIIRISKPSKRVYISINQLRGANIFSKNQLNNLASASILNKRVFSTSLSNSQLSLSHTTSFLPNYLDSSVSFNHFSHSFVSGHQLNSLFFMQGIFILSTSKGIWDHITAHQLNVGGEVLCHIY